jgi:hypothetical protein
MTHHLSQLMWALIAALLVYGGWQLFAALRASRSPRSESEGDDTAPPASDGGGDGGTPPRATIEPRAGSAPPAGTGVDTSRAGADAFALELELQYLKRGLGDLRKALDTQREEINALRVTITALAARSASVEETAASADASPEYVEAQALARRGVPAAEIVQRCGMTLAEAELLVSMAPSKRPGS